MDNVSIAQWFIAIGASTTALVALFRPTVSGWLSRPVLRIEYAPHEPFCRTTVEQPADGVAPSAHVRWIRVRLHNTGRSTARRCKTRVVAVYDDHDRLRMDRDPMPLRWSATGEELHHEPADLAPDEHRFVDVLFTRSDAEDAASFATSPAPPGFPTVLEPHTRHRVRLIVYADNADPRQDDFIVDYDGDWRHVAMTRTAYLVRPPNHTVSSGEI